MARVRNGRGTVYLRGSIYWIKFWGDGKYRYISSGSENKAAAVALLNKHLGEIAEGRYTGTDADRIALAEILEGVITDYQNNARRSLAKAERSKRTLLAFFGDSKAQQIRTDAVRRYTAKRLADGMSNATVNRELAFLKRAYTLARNDGRIYKAPYIPMLKESNARAGFFEPAEFEAVRAHLPEAVAAAVECMYITGWRDRSEVLPLKWSDNVDTAAGLLRLQPGTTKNGEARTFPFAAHPRLAALIERQQARCLEISLTRGRTIAHVFTWDDGSPIKDFYGSWRAACKAAGVPCRIPHDFRRTAVRNLERAGVSRSVAMKLTGHRTEAVYRRYAIVSEGDLAEGVKKVAAMQTAEAAEAEKAARR